MISDALEALEPYFLLACALALGLLASCGGVTAVGSPSDGGAPLETGAPAPFDAHGPALEDAYKDLGAVGDVDMPPEGSAQPITCSEACAACSSSSARVAAGPEYSSPSRCADVVACVRADAGGAYPVMNCHNDNGGGAEWGGFFCVRDLLAAGCR